MKFIVARSKVEAVKVAKTELLWTQTREFVLLDLNNDEVHVISSAREMRGYNVEVVYLLPSFDLMEVNRYQGFQNAFEKRNIRTMRL